MVGDWEEFAEIIEKLFVLVRVSSAFGTDRATCYPFYREDSECQEDPRKTHGGWDMMV